MDDEIRTSQWWICGPAEYTLPILPHAAPDGLGFVYALLFSTGNIKVGQTRQPRQRIKGIASTVETYGDVTLRMVALSHPRADYRELENALHGDLQEVRIKNELFRCDVSAVATALGIRSHRLDLKPRARAGRKPKAWYWTHRSGWYSTINGKRIFLAKDEEMAKIHLRELLQEKTEHGKAPEAVGVEGP